MILFGWWLAVVTLLGGVSCYGLGLLGAEGCQDYGRVLINLSSYLFYPFGKFVKLEHDEAYIHPAIISEVPIVWIPRDKYGLSRQEVNASKQTVGSNSLTVTDEEAWFTEKGKIEWGHEDEGDLRRVPIWEEEPVY